MLKAVIIGSSGHYKYALDAVGAGAPCVISAAAPGPSGEPAFSSMNKAVGQGKIGAVRLFHAQKSYKLGCRPGFYRKRQTYGGTIPWVGAHPIDMIYWLSGRKKYISVSAYHSAKANKGHGELEATAVMMLEMEDEVLATVNTDYLRPDISKTHGDDRLRAVGEAGWCEIVSGRLYINGKEQAVPEAGNIFKDLCMEIAGKGTCSVTNDDSIYVTKICLAARDAADSGKKIFLGEK